MSLRSAYGTQRYVVHNFTWKQRSEAITVPPDEAYKNGKTISPLTGTKVQKVKKEVQEGERHTTLIELDVMDGSLGRSTRLQAPDGVYGQKIALYAKHEWDFLLHECIYTF